MGKLRVRAIGLVPNIEALEDGTHNRKDRRFLGQKFVEVAPGVFGFEPTGVVEVPDRAEYRRAVVEGALAAADKATADACGVVVELSPAHEAPPGPKTTDSKKG